MSKTQRRDFIKGFFFEARTNTTLTEYSGEWTYKQAAHLLRRATIGVTDSEIRAAVTDGLKKTVDKLLTNYTPNTSYISDFIGQDAEVVPPMDRNSDEFKTWQQNQINHRERLMRWWLKIISSNTVVSIQDKMSLFWADHLTVGFDSVGPGEFMYEHNNLYRKYSLGNFKDFIREGSTTSAMLRYLNGDMNFVDAKNNKINENFSRELLELFTTGVYDLEGKANYTQTDVYEGARALTGWVQGNSPKGQKFKSPKGMFLQQRWDSKEKTYLGKTGNWKLDDVINIIFGERAKQVAEFVCNKLYKEFVYDLSAEKDIVVELAKTFQASNWEIKPVLKQLLLSEHFYDNTNVGATHKSPMDYLVGLIRTLQLKNIPDFTEDKNIIPMRELYMRMISQGMDPFEPPNVAGWEGGRAWISAATLPARQKFLNDVMDINIKGKMPPPGQSQPPIFYQFDAVAFAKTFPDFDDIKKLTQNMTQFFLNVEPSKKEFDLLYNTILSGGADYEWKIDDPTQKANERIRKFIKVVGSLAKFQLK